MEDTAFRSLLRRYKGKRVICNCYESYEDEKGNCPGGCSTSQINTKYYIARRALKEIKRLEKGIKYLEDNLTFN